MAKNNGQVQQYFVEDNHDPVIPKEIFLLVQAEREMRRMKGKEFRYLHDSGLSGRVVCGECGNPYRKSTTHGYVYWRCDSKVKGAKHPGTECGNETITEKKLQETVIAAFNALPEKRDELTRLHERVKVLGLAKSDEMLKQIDVAIETAADGEEKRILESKRAEIAAQRVQYAEKDIHIRSLLDRIEALNARRRVVDGAGSEDSENPGNPENLGGLVEPKRLGRRKKVGACPDPEEFFRLTKAEYVPGPVTAFSDDDVIRLVDRILMEKDKITVMFKAGVKVEVDR